MLFFKITMKMRIRRRKVFFCILVMLSQPLEAADDRCDLLTQKAADVNYGFDSNLMVSDQDLDQRLTKILTEDFRKIFAEAEFPYPHQLISKVIDRYVLNSDDTIIAIDDQFTNSPSGAKRQAGLLLKKLIEIHGSPDSDSRLYFESLGHNVAIGSGRLTDQATTPAGDWPQAPENVAGEYWDMASGTFALWNLEKFKTSRTYRLFDVSPYVGRYLATNARANELNIKVNIEDIRGVRRPSQPIAALRIKNAASYAKGFENKLPELAEWIAPGGQIFIQDTAFPVQFARSVHRFGPHIKTLMSRGWTFHFHDLMQPYSMYTLKLERPEKELPVAQGSIDKQWAEFINSVPILK